MVVMYWAQGQDTEQDESLLRVVGGGSLRERHVRTCRLALADRVHASRAARRIVYPQPVQRLDREVVSQTRRQDRACRRIQDRAQVAARRAQVGPEVTPAAEAKAAASSPSLVRRLRPLDAAAIILSNVIGGGIFYVPILVAALVPVALGMLGVWVLGGVLAFAGAMAYAELAALRPRSGGEYVYLREAFGPLAAFLTGWTSFVAGFSGAIAATALFWPMPLADLYRRRRSYAYSGDPDTVRAAGRQQPDTGCAGRHRNPVLFIHMRGSARADRAQLPGRSQGFGHPDLSGARLVARIGSWSNLASSHSVSAPATGWLLALIPVMFSYSG